VLTNQLFSSINNQAAKVLMHYNGPNPKPSYKGGSAMSFYHITINTVLIKLIPSGKCACGCDGNTTVPKVNNAPRNQVNGRPLKYISGHNSRGIKRGRISGRGRHIRTDGYVSILNPDHPRATSNGYMPEHIAIMEKALGRSISKKEVVHHIDGNKENNEIGNLMLFSDNKMHTAYHRRLKAFNACGHWHWRKCGLCHEWDMPDNLWIGKRFAIHRECGNNQMRIWRKRNV
jgi:hypothetical protein